MDRCAWVTYEQCSLPLLLEKRGWEIDEAAEALGDSPLRLYRVLEGDEPLGRTATLAALAILNRLELIS